MLARMPFAPDRAAGIRSRTTQLVAFSKPLASLPTLATPLERGRLGIPTAHRSVQPLHDLLGTLGMLPRQCPPDEDALYALGHVEPTTAQGRVQQDDPLVMTPDDNLGAGMSHQIVPDQHHTHGRPSEALCHLCRVAPVAPATPPFFGLLGQERRQVGEDGAQFLLQPGMQDGIGRPLYGLGAYHAARGMEQRQEFGGAAPDILMGASCRFSLRLPGSARMGNGLIRTGFIFGPGGNTGRFGYGVRLLDVPLFSSAAGSVTVTTPSVRFLCTVPVRHQVRSC